MAECVTGLATSLATECLKGIGKLAWQYSRDYFRGCFMYHKKIAAFREELKKLTDYVEPGGENWRKAVRIPPELRTKASELKDEAQELDKKVDNTTTRCVNVCSRSCTGKQAIRLTEQIGQLITEMDVAVSRAVPPPPPQHDFVELEATKVAKEAVIGALREGGDDFKVVSLYGMPGVGKTSLAKHVEQQVLKDGLFDKVAFVVVSQTPNVSNIHKDIAQRLGIALSATTDEGRASEIYDELGKRQNTLLILDDIWKVDINQNLSLYSVGIPSRDQLKNNCKVLLTTRNFDICKAMSNPAATITLDALLPDDSWTLFKNAAGIETEDPKLMGVQREVVRQCKGLPIALTTTGKAMTGKKELVRWQATAKRLACSKPGKEVTACIKLSYDFLAEKDLGPQAQKCFLICCLFREDYNVPTESLLRYGMGYGAFGIGSYTMEEARREVETVALDLMECRLLLPGEKKGTVKLHDVIRDVAIEIASEGHYKFLVEAGCKPDRWEKRIPDGCTAISLMSTQITDLPDEFDCPSLKLLLLQNNPKLTTIPDAFFDKAKELAVLDLGQVQISKLPPSVGSLSKLFTLCLDHFKSETLSPVVGNLKNLQILSLREARIKTLPEEIKQLICLRMLDITLCTNIHIPYGLLSKLSGLEELYTIGSFSSWEEETGTPNTNTRASLNEVTGLTELKVLTVDIPDVKCMPKTLNPVPKWEKFNIFVCDTNVSGCTAIWEHHPVTFSKDLVLTGKIDMLPKWFKDVVVKNAEKLTYKQSDCLYDILPEYDSDDLANLKVLNIEQCHGVTYLINAEQRHKTVFERLEELYIQHSSEMKQICVGGLPKGSFRSLKLLEVRQCDNLVDVLLPPDLLARFYNLEKLDVSGIYVSHVFGCKGLLEGSYLTKLKEMRLDILPRLSSIWSDCTQTVRFENLKVVQVRECKKLTCLFTMTISKALEQLEDLSIENCSSLEEIVSGAETQQSDRVALFPNLKSLTLKCLKKLTCISAKTGVSEIGSSSLKLQKEDCPNFIYKL